MSFWNWRKKHRGPSRLDYLLAIFYAFDLEEIPEVSLSEFTESIIELQKKHEFGYDFPEGLFYSHRLMEELQSLQYTGTLRHYEYRHDGFLPKSYFRLTLLGKEKGQQISKAIPPPLLQEINAAVTIALDREINRWGLFARSRHRGTAKTIVD